MTSSNKPLDPDQNITDWNADNIAETRPVRTFVAEKMEASFSGNETYEASVLEYMTSLHHNATMASGVMDSDDVTQWHRPPLLKQSASIVVLFSIAYLIVFVLAVVNNTLVVTVIYRNPQMRTITNYFLVNLAIADIMVSFVVLPITLLSNLFTGKGHCERFTSGFKSAPNQLIRLLRHVPYLTLNELMSHLAHTRTKQSPPHTYRNNKIAHQLIKYTITCNITIFTGQITIPVQCFIGGNKLRYTHVLLDTIFY